MRAHLARALRFLWRVLLTDLVLAGAAAAAWWALGWRGLEQFGMALTWAGLAALALAGSSSSGSTQLLGNPNYWYAQSVMPVSMHERVKLNLGNLADGPGRTAVIAVAGLAALLVGLAVWLL
jgi:hypothetical protein